MFVRMAFALMQSSPWLKKFIWKRWYQYIAGYRNAEWEFMNYGYAPTTGEPETVELTPGDEPNRFSIQLYHRVATAVPVVVGVKSLASTPLTASLNVTVKSRLAALVGPTGPVGLIDTT